MIKLPSFDEIPSEILKNTKYYPWFKECRGAIDGTYIPAMFPTDKIILCRSGRKNEYTQNVMAVVLLTWASHGLAWKRGLHSRLPNIYRGHDKIEHELPSAPKENIM